LDTREKFGEGKWFGEIVVAAALEAGNTVVDTAFGVEDWTGAFTDAARIRSIWSRPSKPGIITSTIAMSVGVLLTNASAAGPVPTVSTANPDSRKPLSR
jgi:hypothetical protein